MNVVKIMGGLGNQLFQYALSKHLEKFDEMRVRVPAGRKAEIKAHAEAQGESLNSFMIRAMNEAMERDKSLT